MKNCAKRGSVEIAYDILSVCQKPANKTRIVCRCNLNFSMLKKYLDALAKKGLIDLSDSEANELYKATEKGKEFIRHYRQMVDLMTNKQLKPPTLISNYNNYIPSIHKIR